MQLYPDQQELVDNVRAAMRKSKSVLMTSPTGSGKCLGKDTPILMYDGTIKMVQDVRVGNKLMGPDSKPRTVLEKYRGRETLYKIIPTKGEPFVCNESHILSLKRTNCTQSQNALGYESRTKLKGHIVNISIQDYLQKSKTFKHIYKQYRVGVDFTNNKRLPLSPYYVGAWLGDGHSKVAAITTMDSEISLAVYEESARFNLFVRKSTDKRNGVNTYYNTSAVMGGGILKNEIIERLKKLNLIQNKHIPHIYKTASRADRLELLAGILDTDGSYGKNGYDYISIVEKLSDDVCYLARSLGLAAYKKKCRKECVNNGVWGTYYRVSISGDIVDIPCRLERKKPKARLQKKSVLVTGFVLQNIGAGDYYGFKIDGDRLFMLGDFTVTHNTAMATHMIQAAQSKKNQIIFTVPRKDLLEQTSETFKANGISHSYIAAGKIHNPFAPVFIGMIETMARRLDRLPKAPLIIIDEARYGEGSMDVVVDHFAKLGSYRLGLDATPWKSSGKGLGRWYGTMVQGKSVAWLIQNKRLSDFDYFGGRRKIDLSKVKITAGEYNKAEVADFMEHQGAIIGDCVRAYKEQCMGRIHLVRCASIKHSQMTAEQFRIAGIPAAHVDGETPIEERKIIFRALARREILVVCFCTLLEFGFDLSQASGMNVCIESGSDMKPTKSIASQSQWWGRLLRYKHYPAIINDHVNNFIEHEYPDTEREWTLEDREQNKKSGERATAVKQCEVCYYAHRPAPVCPHCNHVYEIKSREVDEIEGELVKVDRKALKQAQEEKRIDRMRRQQQARTLEDLIEFAKAEGYKAPAFYAAKVFTARKAKR